MIRTLIARSIVVAGFVSIIALFGHEYGIDGIKGLSISIFGITEVSIAPPISFSAEKPMPVTGQFRPGPRATVYRRVAVDLDSADVRAIRFSLFNPDTGSGPGHKVYVDKAEVAKEASEGTVVVGTRYLDLFIKKAGTYGEFPYELMLSHRKLVDARKIEPADSETLVRAMWTKEKEGVWTLQVKGAPGSSGKASITASNILPVISKAPSGLPVSLLEPIPMVVYQDDGPRAICLDFRFATEKYHVLPSRDKFPVAELDLGGDGKKISMEFVVDVFKFDTAGRMNDSCGNLRAGW